jgi:hypothetical protein
MIRRTQSVAPLIRSRMPVLGAGWVARNWILAGQQGSAISRGARSISGFVQAYSALPFNISSGVTTIQATAGRPTVNGAFIERNGGTGSSFFGLNARLSSAFRLTTRVELKALAEGFNLTNRRNVLTRNANFGPGAYPTNPSPNFGQVTAIGEPRAFQFGMRVRF